MGLVYRYVFMQAGGYMCVQSVAIAVLIQYMSP